MNAHKEFYEKFFQTEEGKNLFDCKDFDDPEVKELLEKYPEAKKMLEEKLSVTPCPVVI